MSAAKGTNKLGISLVVWGLFIRLNPSTFGLYFLGARFNHVFLDF